MRNGGEFFCCGTNVFLAVIYVVSIVGGIIQIVKRDKKKPGIAGITISIVGIVMWICELEMWW